MHDTRVGACPEPLGQDRRHIIICTAGVDDQRKLCFLRRLDMDTKAGLLDGFAVGSVVIIQTCFADGHKFWVRRECHQFGHSCQRFFGSAHRVGACGVEDAGMGVGNRAHFWFIAQAGADCDHAGDASRLCAGNQGRDFAVKIGKV